MNDLNDRGYDEETVQDHVIGLLSSLGLHEGVLFDLGCGSGPIAEACAELGLDYVGVDVNKDVLEDLAKRGFSTELLDIADTGALADSLEGVLAGRQLAGITLLDVIGHLASPSDLLAALADLANRHIGVPLVVTVSNVSHFDLAAKLLCGRWDVNAGGLLAESHLSLFAPGTLEVELRRAGWGEIKADDLSAPRSDQHFPETLTALYKGTPLHDFLLEVREQSAPAALVSQFVRAYLPLAPSEPTAVALSPSRRGAAPFLSVVVRTQGRRPVTLEDNLTSLAAQTNRDFEVVVCCHETSDAEYGDVEAVTRRLPPWLAKKTRAIRVEGGGRAQPLAAGVAEATGCYVAFLDDDDLAFCHWVEQFARLAKIRPGAVIRAGCATHAIDEEAWDCGVGYRQTGPTQTPYPLSFDLLDHMVENSTPNCSVAIPRSCFTDLGVSFDDNLPVLEDWDVLMRAALLCGLVSTPEVTSLYRRWRRGYASHVEHSEAQWETAKQSVRGRLDARPFLVPPGTVSRVVELQSRVDSLTSAVASLEGRLGELQLERDELSILLQDAEQGLVAAGETVTEISALANQQVAEAAATAEQQVAEISAGAEQQVSEVIASAERRVAEATSAVAETSSLAERRVAEATAMAEARLIERRAIEAQVDVVVAEREAALRRLDEVADRAATEAAARVRADYESSRSWKMMAPFRKLSWFVPGMRGRVD